MITLSQALLKAVHAKGGDDVPLPWPHDDPWSAVYASCESPIERLMCLGIFEHLGYEAGAGKFEGNRSLPADRRGGALVYGQHEIRRYRVDFLVVGFLRGEEPIRIVVECDGKEFHDAAHDARRDQEIAELGFEIVRFTGREITRALADTIGRIPKRMGLRYAWMIAAEYGRSTATEMTDYLEAHPERPRRQADWVDDDGNSGHWADTL